MLIPCVVWFAVLIPRLLLFCLNQIRLSNSIVASRKWAKRSCVIADAQCACVSLILHSMFVKVVASPSQVVLHVAVGAVDSLVFLVYGWNEVLNPYHIFCGCFCGVSAGILVDRASAAVSGKRKVGSRLGSPVSRQSLYACLEPPVVHP